MSGEESAVVENDRIEQQRAHDRGNAGGFTRVRGVGWVDDARNPPTRGEQP